MASMMGYIQKARIYLPKVGSVRGSTTGSCYLSWTVLGEAIRVEPQRCWDIRKRTFDRLHPVEFSHEYGMENHWIPVK